MEGDGLLGVQLRSGQQQHALPSLSLAAAMHNLLQHQAVVLLQCMPPSPLYPDLRLLLPAQIHEHSTKIQELQVQWQRAKTDEELNAGGAADLKRWTGIKVLAESRELLRTVFRVACDHK